MFPNIFFLNFFLPLLQSGVLSNFGRKYVCRHSWFWPVVVSETVSYAGLGRASHLLFLGPSAIPVPSLPALHSRAPFVSG